MCVLRVDACVHMSVCVCVVCECADLKKYQSNFSAPVQVEP